MFHTDVRELIARFGLVPHPEGGYFKESYRCAQRFTQARPAIDLLTD